MLTGCSATARVSSQALDDVARALRLSRAQTLDLFKREAARQGTNVDDVARAAHSDVLGRAGSAVRVSDEFAGLACDVVVEAYGLDDGSTGSEMGDLWLLSARLRVVEQQHPGAAGR